MKIQDRWFQLGASLVAMVMIANLQYGWTLFVQPLQQSTGWRLSDIQFCGSALMALVAGGLAIALRAVSRHRASMAAPTVAR